jgi:hypothetical protein
LVKKYYTKYILKYQNQSSLEIFQQKMLIEDDWMGMFIDLIYIYLKYFQIIINLKGFTGSILEKVFSVGILTPLESTDKYFSIEVNHLNLSKYTEMIANSELRDDLDAYFIKYNPKRNNISFEIPDINLDELVNNKYVVNNFSDVASNSRLNVELPDHLAITSVIVYNNMRMKSSNQDKEIIKYKSFSLIRNVYEKNDKLYKAKLKK